MLRYRLIFGPIMILALLAVFWLDHRLETVQLTGFWRDLFGGREYLPSGLPMFLLAFSVIPLAALELTRILRANHIMASFGLTAIAGEIGLIVQFSIPQGLDAVIASGLVCTALVVMFVISLAFYSRNQNVEGVVAAAGGTMFAMIYLGLMFGFLLALRRWHPAAVVVAIILVTKACDIGAYFTGRAIGKHKLIPWLSPGKTWEGLAGGLILSGVVAGLLAWWGTHHGDVAVRDGLTHRYAYPLPFAVMAGITFGFTGQVGDLTASLLKRDAGLKDSSNTIPGFGGVLDVVDSPLLVAPLAYWLLTLA